LTVSTSGIWTVSLGRSIQKEVEAAGINEPIYVGEGEKDTHTLEALGLVATTCPQGAGKWMPHYNQVLKGQTVILIEDKDEAGKAHVLQVAEDLSPVAKSVKILRIPNLPEKGDVTDFVEAGGTREELEAMVASTPEYSAVGAAIEASGWGEMKPLPSATPSVPTLDSDLLPVALQPWLKDIAKRAPVPLEMVAMPALSALGSVIGRQVGIKPDKFNDYVNVGNLWGAVVARSGKFKTYALDEGLKPVTRLEAEISDAYENDAISREAAQVFLKAETDNLNTQIKDAVKKADSTKSNLLEAELKELIEKREKVEKPAKRMMTQDATVEKIGELLQQNPNGLLVSRDELAGFLQTLERAGREGDREFFLEAHNGTGSFTVDRIGRGLIRIKSMCITLCGGIQPGKLKRYTDDAMSNGVGSDGLLQRVQLLVFPDDSSFPVWVAPTTRADAAAKNNAFKVYERLSDIRLPNSIDPDSNAIPALQFTDDAQELHTDFRTDLEARLHSEFALAPAFESHVSKYRSLIPSLALIFYLADLQAGEPIGDVGVEPLMRAIKMGEYLELHARKVYATELNPGLAPAFALSKKILSGAVTDGTNVRDIYRKGWSDLSISKDVYAAAEVLERLGWVRIDREVTGGRPTETLSLHPELLKDKTDG
jgi:hypothetical protein